MSRGGTVSGDAQKAARRSELIDAAIRVIRRDGAAVSMDAIAAEVGVTKPILYRYFGDRDGLAGAVAERAFAQISADLGEALGSPGGDREILVATIDAYVSFVERDPDLYRYLMTRAGPTAGPTHGGSTQGRNPGRSRGAPAEALEGFAQQVAGAVAFVIGERLRAGGADSGAAEPWAYALVGMVHMSSGWWLERRTMPRATFVEYLATLVYDGMGSVGATSFLSTPLSLAPFPSTDLTEESSR